MKEPQTEVMKAPKPQERKRKIRSDAGKVRAPRGTQAGIICIM